MITSATSTAPEEKRAKMAVKTVERAKMAELGCAIMYTGGLNIKGSKVRSTEGNHSARVRCRSMYNCTCTVALTEIRPKVQSWRPGSVPITSLWVYMCTSSRIHSTARASRAVEVEGASFAHWVGFQ